VPNPANRLWAYFQILDFIRKLFQGQTNTPAYFNSASVTKQKKFVTWTATNSRKKPQTTIVFAPVAQWQNT